MTCSTSIDEMLSRPVRMTFIEYEAQHAACVEECRWPPGSHEHTYWMEFFQKKTPRPVQPGGFNPSPKGRDPEMATFLEGKTDSGIVWGVT
jgi:hypothetical protein